MVSTSTSIISKRIFSTLLVAISSILATRKAKLYFDSKCNEKLSISGQCHLSSIRSEVRQCVRTNYDEYDNPTKHWNNGIEEERTYMCYGNCVQNFHLKKEETKKQFEDIECEKLKREGEVTIAESDLIFEAMDSTYSTKFTKTAPVKFAEKYLVKFCKTNSLREYDWSAMVPRIINGKKMKKKYIMRQKHKGSGCVANRSSVKCIQTKPQPTSTNWKWRLKVFNERKEEWEKI